MIRGKSGLSALFILCMNCHYEHMKILILFAHPKISESIVQKEMLSRIQNLEGITIHDLYASYPDFVVDVEQEQALLQAHDIIVFQHPFYWYSAPSIIKEWLDLVLEHDWAYGTKGNKLHGKFMMQAISTGGPEGYYNENGKNRFEIRDLLNPFNQTAYLCGMGWLEPFAIFIGRRISKSDLNQRAEDYRELVMDLHTGKIDPLKKLAKGYKLPGNFRAKKG
jgi:glutathione-regulated potassium-efflux system ancillary protein KefG